MSQNLSSAADVIGALRVNYKTKRNYFVYTYKYFVQYFLYNVSSCRIKTVNAFEQRNEK